MTDKKKQVIKVIINYTTSMISSLVVFLFCALLAVGIMTSKWYIQHTVSSTNYIDNSALELKESMISLAIPSGLPENFFDDKINTEALKNLNAASIDNAYDNGKFSVDTKGIKEYHVALFNTYATSGALASDVDVTEESIGYLAELCTEKYEKTAANSVFKYLAFYSAKINRLAPFGIIGIGVFAALCILFMLKLSKAQNDKSFLYYSICGGGIMTALAPITILIGKFVNKISISSRAMHTFLTAFVNNILIIMAVLGAIIILVAVFVLLFEKKAEKN